MAPVTEVIAEATRNEPFVLCQNANRHTETMQQHDFAKELSTHFIMKLCIMRIYTRMHLKIFTHMDKI